VTEPRSIASFYRGSRRAKTFRHAVASADATGAAALVREHTLVRATAFAALPAAAAKLHASALRMGGDASGRGGRRFLLELVSCGRHHTQRSIRTLQPTGGSVLTHSVPPSVFVRGSLFKLNRYTPEAQSNQLKWAREQMDLEVPEATADGDSIADREDFINKYMASERSKFGRELDRATAEAEVDEWLLKQATFAPAKTRCVLAGRAPCEDGVPSSPSVRAPEPSSLTRVHRLALARPRYLAAAPTSRSPCSSSWPPLAASYTLQASRHRRSVQFTFG